MLSPPLSTAVDVEMEVVAAVEVTSRTLFSWKSNIYWLISFIIERLHQGNRQKAKDMILQNTCKVVKFLWQCFMRFDFCFISLVGIDGVISYFVFYFIHFFLSFAVISCFIHNLAIKTMGKCIIRKLVLYLG